MNRFFCVVVLFISFSASAQIADNFKLPETWSKDFTITLSYHSGMSNSNTDVRFTYDSCIYKHSSNHSKPASGVFLLKDSDRTKIFKKLNENKANEIKSESGVHVVHDGWSQSMCFNMHCIEGGTSAEMTEDNKNRFLEVYRYLEEFAATKGKKK